MLHSGQRVCVYNERVINSDVSISAQASCAGGKGVFLSDILNPHSPRELSQASLMNTPTYCHCHPRSSPLSALSAAFISFLLAFYHSLELEYLGLRDLTKHLSLRNKCHIWRSDTVYNVSILFKLTIDIDNGYMYICKISI